MALSLLQRSFDVKCNSYVGHDKKIVRSLQFCELKNALIASTLCFVSLPLSISMADDNLGQARA